MANVRFPPIADIRDYAEKRAMNPYAMKVLIAVLPGCAIREFLEWMGYTWFVGTVAGVATVIAFYGVLMLRSASILAAALNVRSPPEPDIRIHGTLRMDQRLK
jgi:hypothetical protein